MFKTDDYVITKSSGVCRIINAEKSSGGDTIFILEPCSEAGTVVRAPYESGDIVRKVMTKAEAEELVDRIPYITTLKIPKKNMTEAIFTSAMAQWDALEWIKVLKTAYLAEKEKRLSAREKSLAETAKQYLHCELSLALNIPLEEVESYIQSSVKNNF